MSLLLSNLRTTLSTKTTSITSTITNTLTTTSTTTRQYWREVLRQTPNPKNPSLITFEDPTKMAARSARSQASEGLLRRRGKYIRYEKPWMKRKKLKMAIKYRSMEKGVNDLKKYVKFVQDGRDVLDGKK